MNKFPRDGNRIVIGKWAYDEKREPELAKQDKWRKKQPVRPLARKGDPIILDRSLLQKGHTVIRGMTGSGKTSKGLLQLIMGLLPEYTRTWETALGARKKATEHDAIVVIDLGGDKQMFHTVKKKQKG